MKKIVVSLAALAVCASGLFAASYEVDLNKAAKSIKMENDYVYENGVPTKNLSGYKGQVAINRFLGARLRAGDTIRITGSGTVDKELKELTAVIVDNSPAANGWKELSPWQDAADSVKAGEAYQLDWTMTISADAESAQRILLFFHSSAADGIPTLTAATASSQGAKSSAAKTAAAKTSSAKEKSSASSEAKEKKSSSKSSAAASEDRYTCGIDIDLSLPIRFVTLSASQIEFKETAVAIGWKLQTYDCLWANGHVGLYAMLGIGFNMSESNRSFKYGGETFNLADDSSGVFNFNFAVGPAFGTYLGSSNVRLNVGAGLHIHYHNFEEVIGVGQTLEGKGFWMGFNVNPQLRLTANRRCSFVFGCELNFDGCVGGELGFKGGDKTDIKDLFDSTFQFTLAPYAGLGFNF